jgi:hypothetical protein
MKALKLIIILILITNCKKETTYPEIDKDFTLKQLSDDYNQFLIGSLFNYKYVYDTPDCSLP